MKFKCKGNIAYEEDESEFYPKTKIWHAIHVRACATGTNIIWKGKKKQQKYVSHAIFTDIIIIKKLKMMLRQFEMRAHTSKLHSKQIALIHTIKQ